MPGSLIGPRHPVAIARIVDDSRLDLQPWFPQHNPLPLLQRRPPIPIRRSNLAELDQLDGLACQRIEVYLNAFHLFSFLAIAYGYPTARGADWDAGESCC